jgi:hypothetical protein
MRMRSAIGVVFLLIAASVFGAVGGKWALETHHGCKVWDDPPYDERYTSEYKLWWSGTCSEGYASGDGYLQWGVPPDKRYPNDLPLVFAQYDGTIVKGKLQGKGKLSLSTSYTYTGDFVDGQFEGSGNESWYKGDSFEGRYANGYRNGWGTYHFSNGDARSGEFKDDTRQDGFQTYDWAASKDHFEGNVVGNLPEGHGFLIDKTGKHEGTWVAGKLTIGSNTYSVFPVQKNEKPSQPAP